MESVAILIGSFTNMQLAMDMDEARMEARRAKDAGSDTHDDVLRKLARERLREGAPEADDEIKRRILERHLEGQDDGIAAPDFKEMMEREESNDGD